MKIKFKFNTLSGPQEIIMSLEDAVKTEVGQNVRSFAEDDMCTGGVVNSSILGRVEIEKIEEH